MICGGALVVLALGSGQNLDNVLVTRTSPSPDLLPAAAFQLFIYISWRWCQIRKCCRSVYFFHTNFKSSQKSKSSERLICSSMNSEVILAFWPCTPSSVSPMSPTSVMISIFGYVGVCVDLSYRVRLFFALCHLWTGASSTTYTADIQNGQFI